MRRYAIIIVLLCTTIVSTPAEPSMVVPWLSNQDEALFTRADGSLSLFWTSGAVYDSLALVPGSDGLPGWDVWDGPQDARLVARVAAGKAGLYMMAHVRDDSWAPSTAWQWGPDVLTFYLDSMGSVEIGKCTMGCSGDTDVGQLTTTSLVLSLRMGIDSTVGLSVFRCGQMGCSGVNVGGWPFDAAEVTFGIQAEVVQLSAGARAAELMVPWSHLGVLDLAQLQGVVEKGFTVNYKDSDEGGDSAISVLAWGNSDPLAVDPRSLDTASAWGDLLIDERSDVVRPPISGTRVAARGVEYNSRFDLRGRRADLRAVGVYHTGRALVAELRGGRR